MAKKNKEAEAEEIEESKTPQSVLSSFLKSSKTGDHYNFEKDNEYKVACSSLILTSHLEGGISNGAHRFLGLSGGGKSSCALDFMYHFLQDKTRKRKGVYIKSEGRLSENVRNRSGISFCKDAESWKDGYCFIFESNIYEAVFKLKRDLIENNPSGTEFFFITDCTDSLIKRDDARKSEEESITVGGGSLITSVFLKKVGLAMAKRGHVDLYISQIRDQIKINQYEVTIPKQGKASGPRSLEHQAGVVLEFLPRYNGDLILEGEKGSKINGHFCKVKIVKSDNEKNMVECRYPVRYGQAGGKSVWIAYELADFMLSWEIVKKKPEAKTAAWLIMNEGFRQDIIKDTGKEVPESFNGIAKVRDWLENDSDLCDYISNKMRSTLF